MTSSPLMFNSSMNSEPTAGSRGWYMISEMTRLLASAGVPVMMVASLIADQSPESESVRARTVVEAPSWKAPV